MGRYPINHLFDLHLLFEFYEKFLLFSNHFVVNYNRVISSEFFRNPERKIPEANENKIYAPADGKVVVIEEVFEPEYFKSKRIQVSIFMNPLNVHVNRYPISGTVMYSQYHAGKYLVAWDPKASTENERTTVVVKMQREKKFS